MPNNYRKASGERLWEAYSFDKVKFDDLTPTGQKELIEYGISTGRLNPEKLSPVVFQSLKIDMGPKEKAKAPATLIDRVKGTVGNITSGIGSILGGREKPAPSSIDNNLDFNMPKFTPTVKGPNLNTKVEVPTTDNTTANNYLLNSLGSLLPKTEITQRPERHQGPANRAGSIKPQIEMPSFKFESKPIELPQRLHEKIETGEVKPKLEIGGHTLFDSGIDKEAERLELIERDKIRAEKEKEARRIRSKYSLSKLIDDGNVELIEKGWNMNGTWMVANPKAAKNFAEVMKPLDTVFDSDFMARSGQRAADMLLGRKTPDELKPSTDNKALDFVSDVVGSIGGLSTPMPGMGNSIYDLSRKVSTPVGNKATEMVTNKINLGSRMTDNVVEKLGVFKAIDLMNIHSTKKAAYQILYKSVPSTARTIASLGTIQAIEEVRSANTTEEKVQNMYSAIKQGAFWGGLGTLFHTFNVPISKFVKNSKIKGLSINSFDKDHLIKTGYKKLQPGIWGKEVTDGTITDVVVEGVLHKGEIMPIINLSRKELNEALSQSNNTITRYSVGFDTQEGLSEILTKSGYEKVPGRNDTFVNPKTNEIKVLGTKEGADYIPLDHASEKIDTVRESLSKQGISFSGAKNNVSILEPVNKSGWRITARNAANEMYTKRLAEKGYKEAKNGLWQLTDNNGKVVDVVYEYAYTGKVNPVPAFRLESLLPKHKGTNPIIEYWEKEIYKNQVPNSAKTQIEQVLPMEQLMEKNARVGNKLFENMVKLETLPKEVVNKAFKNSEMTEVLNMIQDQHPTVLEMGASLFNEMIKNLVPEIKNVTEEDLKSIQEWNRELQTGKVSQTAIENAPTTFLVDFVDDIHYSEHRVLQDAVIDELNLRGYTDVMNKKNAPVDEVVPEIIEPSESLNPVLENNSIPNIPVAELEGQFGEAGKPQEEVKPTTSKEVSVGDTINFEGTEYKIKNVDGKHFTAVNTKTGETGFLPKGTEVEEHFKHTGTRNNDIPMEDRELENVGNKKVKAYQWNNPEVKPFFTERAKELLKDLSDTVKGERIPVKDDEGYIVDYMGQPRVTSEDIARIKDITGASYDKIKDALERIVRDEGAENTALAKKIELILDDSLSKGYRTFDGTDIPANDDYINIRNSIEGNVAAPKANINTTEQTTTFKGDLPNPVNDGEEFTNQMTIAIPGEQASVFDSPATVVDNEMPETNEVREKEVKKSNTSLKSAQTKLNSANDRLSSARSVLEENDIAIDEIDTLINSDDINATNEYLNEFDHNTKMDILNYIQTTKEVNKNQELVNEWQTKTEETEKLKGVPSTQDLLKEVENAKSIDDLKSIEETLNNYPVKNGDYYKVKYEYDSAMKELGKTKTPEVTFNEGDRVTYTSDGKALTGTIRSISDYSSMGMGMVASVDVDQIAHVGRVPIGRIETISLSRLSKIEDVAKTSEDKEVNDSVEKETKAEIKEEQLVTYDDNIIEPSLKDYNLEIIEGKTKTGIETLNVLGDSKAYSDMLGKKGLGGIWYGSKIGWSYLKKQYATKEELEKAILDKLPKIEHDMPVDTTTDTTINPSTNISTNTTTNPSTTLSTNDSTIDATKTPEVAPEIKEETKDDSANSNVENKVKKGSEVNEPVSTNEVRTDGEETLGRTQSDDVQGTDENREADRNVIPGTGENEGRNGRSDRAGDGLSDGMGNDEGEVSTTTSREREPDRVEKEIEEIKEKATANPKGQNVVIKKEFELGGPKEKFKGNVAAIKLLKKLESEDRPATPKEQKVLLQYVGWGGLSDAFYSNYKGEAKAGWEKEHKEIMELLTDAELRKARESTTNAFYTPISVIKGMYKGLEKLGLKGGRMIEPALGTGHFIGAMPENMREKFVNVTGIELDSLTGRIATKLYPDANIQVKGYEQANIPNNFYDLAISNVPFDDIGIADKSYPNYVTSSLREYFFIKALDNVRPGGIVAFITSKSTLDNKTVRPVRELMAQKADFLGAIRLPNDTFKDNAGTTVLTDIIILKKREEGTAYSGAEFKGLEKFNTGTYMTAEVNEYFVNNPDMVLGETEVARGRYGDYEMKVKSPENFNVQNEIAKAFTKISKVGKMEYKETIKEISPETTGEILPAPDHVKEGAYALKDGKLYIKEGEKLMPYEAKNAKEEERIKGLMGIRDAVRKLHRLELEEAYEAEIKKARAELNKVYDNFTKENDAIHSKANSLAFSDDPDYYMLLSIEKDYNADTKKAEKGAAFFINTVSPVKPVEKVDTPQEALIVSLNELGTPDIPRMKRLTGLDEETIIKTLEGRMFKNEYGTYETVEKYLSGNVVEKLKQAKAMAEVDSSYKTNIKYLEEVQPKKKYKENIRLQLGSPWLPAEIYREFLGSIFNAHTNAFKMSYIKELGEYSIKSTSYTIENSTENTSEWGTDHKNRSAIDIIERVMNNKTLKVTYTDSEGRTHTDKTATMAVQEKAEKLKEQFLKWVWEDEKRTKQIEDLFNETQNNINLIKYDGTSVYPEDHRFPGMNPARSLRDHQKTAVWRVISSGGNTLLAHRVGAGKTFEMITAAMELRRLGIVKKPMFVVPNHLVEQWGSDFMLLYPGANILVPTKKDFQPAKRKTLLNRIAMGDYDAIIVPESQFGMISMSEEAVETFFRDQIDRLETTIKLEVQQGNRSDRSGSEKAINNAIKSLRTAMSKALDKIKKDKDVLNFEELGVDSLFVDEAHRFKNLMYATKMNNVSGLGDKKGSGKAFDMYMKTRYLQSVNGGKGIVFATATPIMNSMAEMYTMQRYLQPDLMKQRGFDSFDAWANTFGKIVTVLEMSPEGGGFRQKQSFSKFVNVGQMVQMFRSFTDVLTDIPGLKIPDLKGGKSEIVTAKPSKELKEFIESLVERAERVRNKQVDSSVDNMLVITNDGRKAALDIRLMDSSLPDYPDSKVNMAVRNIYDVWDQTKKDKSTQVVFMDLSTPDDSNFNLYDDMRNKLLAMGVPKNEIKFIHEAKTDAQKLKLFDDMNTGRVRVLFGSTEKMGVGMNAQKKMIALHHMDAPWRPGDIEQREGRIIRQGNENQEVEILTYVTEESFDARSWDNLKRKADFINTAMNGTVDMVEMEDVGEMALSYQEIAAIASGNPLIMEQATNSAEVQKYANLKRAHEEDQHNLRNRIRSSESHIKYMKNQINTLVKDKKKYKDITGDKFTINIDGKTYTDRKKAGDAIIKFFQAATKGKKFVSKDRKPIDVKIGEFAGFELYTTSSSQMILKGSDWYTSYISDNELGTIMSLQNSIPKFDTEILNKEKSIKTEEEDIRKTNTRVGIPFEHEEKLKTVVNRQNEINELLNPAENEDTDSDAEADEVDFETKARENQKDAKGSKVGIVNNPDIFGPKNFDPRTSFQFTDPDVGERFVSSHGIKPDSKMDKLKDTLDILWKQTTRDFEHLPNEARFEEARFALRKLKAQRDVANDKTLLYMKEVTNNIQSPEERFQFEVKVVLDNLMENMENGQGLAFGYDEETLRIDHAEITKIVEANDFIKEAIETRRDAWNDIKDNYIKTMKSIGFDVGDKFQRENYFRQQVLEYTQLKRITGTGNKLKTPTYRGYLKQRKGGYDFNTNYLEAEYEVMSQMIYDTEIARTLKHIKDKYDIAPKLKVEAKKLTKEAMAPIKKKIKEDLEAGSITKEQSKELLKLAKEEYGTKWESLIPEGYVSEPWLPDERSIFYKSKPVTGELAEMIFDKMGVDMNTIKDPNVKNAIKELLSELDKQRPVMAFGGKRSGYVIPVELAETLDELTTSKDAGPLGKIFNQKIAKSLNMWKAYQLMSPRRAWKYNLRNISGDGEAVALGNPRTLKKIPEASKQIYQVFAKKEPVTGEMHQWFIRGGMQSLLEVQELGDVNELEIFAKIQNQEKSIKAIPKNAVMLYWKNARMATESREAILRYAAYLDYLDQMQNNPNGLPNNYGASDPDRVKGLSDIRDRAYKLSNELLGAYDSISVMGQDIRKYVIPFWSFQEVNFKRYIQLFKNASYVDEDNVNDDGKLIGAGGKGKGKKKFKAGATFTARMAAKFVVKAAMLSSMLFAWNNLFFPDEEKELPMDIQRSPHIVLGRNKDGSVRYFTNLGMLDDFLSWFGMDTMPYDVKDFLNGKKTIGEIASKIVLAPTVKVLNGLTPLVKMPAELVTNKVLFPDPFNPSSIRDPYLYLAQGLSLADEYKALTGKPGKPYRESLSNIFVYKTEVNRSAYYDMYDIKDRFKKMNGKSTFRGEPSTDDKSMALYYLKQSIYHNDEAGFKKYIAEYFINGGTNQGLNQSINNLHPLSGIAKADQGQFLKQLTDEEKLIYDKANEYYTDIIIGRVKTLIKK